MINEADYINDNQSFVKTGLCGAVHTSVARHIRNSLGKGKDSKIICLGDKARSALQKQFAEHFLFVCNEVFPGQIEFSRT